MKLLEFPHSHYCEKARWALEYKGIPFLAVPILPGFHIITVRRHAPDTSVPVLLSDERVVQGSSEIIDYLEASYHSRPLTPRDPDERQACLEIEHAMDVRLGETIRSILYDRLLAYPEFIRYCFTHPMSELKQFVFRLIYPVLRYKIRRTYVGSPAQVERARRDFDAAMGEIEKKLEGQEYLVGGKFSRADLSVASMLSLLVMPAEHPFPWKEIPDRQAIAFYEAYRNHPVAEWVRKMYRKHRLGVAGQDTE